MSSLTRKMFNCPTCGPLETAFVQGHWASEEYTDMVFEVVRPDFNTFEATVADRSPKKPEGMVTPRILADIESFCEEQRKFQCSKCNRLFVIPKKVAADASAVSGGPATLGANAGGVSMSSLFNPQMPQVQPVTGGPVPTNTAPLVGANRSAIYAKLDAVLTEADLDEILTDVGDDPNNYADKIAKMDEIMDRLY